MRTFPGCSRRTGRSDGEAAEAEPLAKATADVR